MLACLVWERGEKVFSGLGWFEMQLLQVHVCLSRSSSPSPLNIKTLAWCITSGFASWRCAGVTLSVDPILLSSSFYQSACGESRVRVQTSPE